MPAPMFIGEADTFQNHRGPSSWGAQREKQVGVTKRGLLSSVVSREGLGQLEGSWQGAEPSLVGSHPIRPSSQTGFEAVAATG